MVYDLVMLPYYPCQQWINTSGMDIKYNPKYLVTSVMLVLLFHQQFYLYRPVLSVPYRLHNQEQLTISFLSWFVSHFSVLGKLTCKQEAARSLLSGFFFKGLWFQYKISDILSNSIIPLSSGWSQRATTTAWDTSRFSRIFMSFLTSDPQSLSKEIKSCM